MAEWSNAPVSKTGCPVRGSRVRIPVSPQAKNKATAELALKVALFFACKGPAASGAGMWLREAQTNPWRDRALP